MLIIRLFVDGILEITYNYVRFNTNAFKIHRNVCKRVTINIIILPTYTLFFFVHSNSLLYIYNNQPNLDVVIRAR